jgi:hypothetical protein
MHTTHEEPALETQENTLKHEQEPIQLFASTASTYQVVFLFWAASFFFSTVPETFSLYRRPSRLVRKGTRKSLKFTFIDTDSTFDCLYPLDFRQSPSITEFCRNQVHTGTLIQTVSTFTYFDPLNLCQSPSMLQICPNQVHTGTSGTVPHCHGDNWYRSVPVPIVPMTYVMGTIGTGTDR